MEMTVEGNIDLIPALDVNQKQGLVFFQSNEKYKEPHINEFRSNHPVSAFICVHLRFVYRGFNK